MAIIKFRQWQATDGLLNMTDDLIAEFQRDNPDLTDSPLMYPNEMVSWFFESKRYGNDPKMRKKFVEYSMSGGPQLTEALESEYDDATQQDLFIEYFDFPSRH